MNASKLSFTKSQSRLPAPSAAKHSNGHIHGSVLLFFAFFVVDTSPVCSIICRILRTMSNLELASCVVTALAAVDMHSIALSTSLSANWKSEC